MAYYNKYFRNITTTSRTEKRNGRAIWKRKHIYKIVYFKKNSSIRKKLQGSNGDDGHLSIDWSAFGISYTPI